MVRDCVFERSTCVYVIYFFTTVSFAGAGLECPREPMGEETTVQEWQIAAELPEVAAMGPTNTRLSGRGEGTTP